MYSASHVKLLFLKLYTQNKDKVSRAASLKQVLYIIKEGNSNLHCLPRTTIYPITPLYTIANLISP